MKISLDTNILAYAEGLEASREDRGKRTKTLEILPRLRLEHDLCVPAQVLGELFAVLTRKSKKTAAIAQESVLAWSDTYSVLDTTATTLMSAMSLVTQHSFHIWDATIFAASERAKCRLLLSEDMHDGFTWGGLTVVNPYAKTPHSIIAPYLT